jgi:hypothetical protein
MHKNGFERNKSAKKMLAEANPYVYFTVYPIQTDLARKNLRTIQFCLFHICYQKIKARKCFAKTKFYLYH